MKKCFEDEKIEVWYNFNYFFMALFLTSCAGNGEAAGTGSRNAESAVTEGDSSPGSNTSNSEIGRETMKSNETEGTANSSEADEVRILVAYFSATNTTEGIAEYVADSLDAELYEIVPEVPYTDADLNYNDNNSRSTIEMNDPSARSAISGSAHAPYDIVFIGYGKY